MNTAACSLAMQSSYEEEFIGFEIYIEPNPDRWREGFVWLICKDVEEIDSGLDFSLGEAILCAKKAFDKAGNSAF